MSADRIHGIHFGEDESLAVHDKIMWAICCKNMWESLRTVQRSHPFLFCAPELKIEFCAELRGPMASSPPQGSKNIGGLRKQS